MNVETKKVETPQDLFVDQELYQYEYVSNGQRFVNWLIDNLFMRFALSWASGYAIAYIFNNYFQEFVYRMILEKGIEYYFTLYLIGVLNYIVYYTICEKAFKGYTLGKLVSGTRAIRQDGSELSFGNALLRTLSRLVPFETFSIWFGNGLWHDTWTKTMVVKTR